MLKMACVTLTGPIISAEVVRVCGSSNRGALPELILSLSGMGAVGINDELLCGALLGWKVLGDVMPVGGAGVGDPIDGAIIPGAPVGGATKEGCVVYPGVVYIGVVVIAGAA